MRTILTNHLRKLSAYLNVSFTQFHALKFSDETSSNNDYIFYKLGLGFGKVVNLPKAERRAADWAGETYILPIDLEPSSLF